MAVGTGCLEVSQGVGPRLGYLVRVLGSAALGSKEGFADLVEGSTCVLVVADPEGLCLVWN